MLHSNDSTNAFRPESWLQLSWSLVFNATVSIPASSWVIWNLVFTIPRQKLNHFDNLKISLIEKIWEVHFCYILYLEITGNTVSGLDTKF